MLKNSVGLAVHENINGEEMISHLIETARALLDLDVVQSKEFFEKAQVLSENINFKTGTGDCLFEIAKILHHQGDTTAAFRQLQEANIIFETTSDFQRIYDCSSYLCDVCFDLGNYDHALNAELKALNASKQLKDSNLIGDALNKTGNIYKALGSFALAIDYHEQALQIFVNLKDSVKICKSEFYTGNCYNWTGNLEKAFSHLEKSLEIADSINDPALQVRPTGSIAILFTKLKDFDKATDFFYRSIDFVNITGDHSLKADLLRNLGNLLVEKNEFESAIQSLNESLQISESSKVNIPSHLVHYSLANAFEKSGDFEKALNQYKLFNEKSSKLLGEEVQLKTKGIQLSYDFEEAKNEKELAELAVKFKDQFIADISYEIRTPLNDVLGMADLLTDTNPSAEQQEYIKTIRLAANNLIFIINDLLDYSKIQSGEVHLEKSAFNLRNLIEELAQLMKVKCDEKKIQLNFEIDENIPELLIGDASRLKQILLNLLNNAEKFTEKGTISSVVQMIQANGNNINILFTVTDTGIGIQEEYIHKIFESFTQINSGLSKTTSGSGLGLAIVKQLVDLKGGTVSVNSTVDKGSVFKVELPFKLVHPFESHKGPAKAKRNLEIKDLSDFIILLVEDNKVNQFLAQKLLTKMGFSVTIANNGAEAIDFLNKEKFNLILMDVQMPEMNGYELTEIIRTSMPEPVKNIPIIALTAYASTQEKEKALMLGMSDYITKPYSPHELMTVIMKQVNSSKASENNPDHQPEIEISEEVISQTSDKLIQLFSGNIKDVISLLQMLVVQIPTLLNEVESHIQEKNWKTTFQTVHKLKSSMNLLKINQLVSMIDELEELSQNKTNTKRISEVFKKLKLSSEKTVGLLKDEIVRLKKLN